MMPHASDSGEKDAIHGPDKLGMVVFPLDDHLEIQIAQATSGVHAAHGAAGSSLATPAQIDEAWARLCQANPRLFDGPMLSVASWDHARKKLTCIRSSYKHLAVQAGAGLDAGAEQFSVTGVLVRRDASGIERVLLARRGMTTRIYGGMWELGPSGGIDPPPQAARTVTRADILRQLDEEILEELGKPVALRAPRIIALCRDPIAHSLDVVVRAEIHEGVADPLAATSLASSHAAEPWEYDAARWVSREEAQRWDHEHNPLIPPTAALLQWMGWIKASP